MKMENEVELLSSTTCHTDEANNGMTHSDAIQLVRELTQIFDCKAAENHFDCLGCMQWLKGVKNCGCTIKTQSVTTKRAQILVEQLLCWHSSGRVLLAITHA